MIAIERRKRIYEMALQRGAVAVSELAELLGAAENTIRSDLAHLEKEGKLIRSRGGALLKESGQPMPPYRQVKDTNMLQKSWIAEAAVGYIPTSGTVFINAGSTTRQLAMRMPEQTYIDIFTNSPEIATYLVSSKNAQVALVGGRMVAESMETDGEFSQDLLNKMYWDVAFVGVTALDTEHGITSINYACAQMEAQVISNSKLAIGLCDSSKLGKYARTRACAVDKLDVLITDVGANEKIVKRLVDRGIKVITAGVKKGES